MKINKTTGWSLGTTGLCIALTAGSWFALVEPQRAAAAESRELTVAAQDTNGALEAEIEQLREQFADLPSKQAELAAIRLALPSEPALAQLIRDVSLKSTDSGSTLDSVTAAAPIPVVAAAEAVVAPDADAPAEGAAPEPSPAPSETAAPADPSAEGAPAAPPAVAAAAGPVLAAIPVVITVTGDFTSSTLFLKNVQAEMPRAFLVDSLVLTVQESGDSDPGSIQTVLSGRVFAFVDPTEIPDVPVLPTTPSDG